MIKKVPLGLGEEEKRHQDGTEPWPCRVCMSCLSTWVAEDVAGARGWVWPGRRVSRGTDRRLWEPPPHLLAPDCGHTPPPTGGSTRL